MGRQPERYGTLDRKRAAGVYSLQVRAQEVLGVCTRTRVAVRVVGRGHVAWAGAEAEAAEAHRETCFVPVYLFTES